MFKNLINRVLGFLNLRLVNKKFTGSIDKRKISSFDEGNENIKLYFEALKKSENVHTDNFFKQSRHLDLINLVKNILKEKKVYDFAECGCWKGHSSYFISKLILKSDKNIKFHIFDSFEGLSKETPKDNELLKLNKNGIEKIRSQFLSNEDFVRNKVLKEFQFVNIYKGWIPEKFKIIENSKFSFVHIDVDLYEPTYKSLEFFYPRLVEGGIIVCDDYNSKFFDGSKKAWDEFFLKNKFKINFSPSLGSIFVIK